MHSVSRSVRTFLLAAILILVPVCVRAQDVPSEGLQIRIRNVAILRAVNGGAVAGWSSVEKPTPYTAAVVHPHHGHMSVSIAEGTLEKGATPERWLKRDDVEFFFYDRILSKSEMSDLRSYVDGAYNGTPATASDGVHQSVHIRGKWTLEVRNPDGTLAERRAFENAFIGSSPMSQILAHQNSVGVWVVDLDGDSGSEPCVNDNAEGTYCSVWESGVPVSDASMSKNLQVAANSNALQLTGTATAGADGVINQVSTGLNLCSEATSPAECQQASVRIWDFTLTSLDSPVSVTKNQQIAVEVDISFN